MPKRRAGTSSSSNGETSDTDGWSRASIDDPSFTLSSGGAKMNKKSSQPPLASGKGSLKRARNCSAVSGQRGTSPVASTSTQLQRELGAVVKEEIEESEVECIELTDSSPERMDSIATSSAGQQPTPELRKSKRVSSKVSTSKEPKKLPPSKTASKPHEKYFEGCLVKAEGDNDYPYWPGMIRKPGANQHPDYICHEDGKTFLLVQFFIDPIHCDWREPAGLRVFDAAKPNRCYHRDPDVVEEFEKGIKIAKAAANFSVDDRLKKFTLLDGADIDCLLREIDEWNGQHEPRNDLVTQDEDESALPAQEDGRNSPDSVDQYVNEPAPPAQGNEESSIDLVASMKKRMSDYQQKLREECNREKDETIKRLTTEKSKLAKEKNKLKATVKEQAKVIAELRQKQEKEKLEKMKYKEEVDTMKTAFDEMFGGGNKGGTQK